MPKKLISLDELSRFNDKLKENYENNPPYFKKGKNLLNPYTCGTEGYRDYGEGTSATVPYVVDTTFNSFVSDFIYAETGTYQLSIQFLPNSSGQIYYYVVFVYDLNKNYVEKTTMSSSSGYLYITLDQPRFVKVFVRNYGNNPNNTEMPFYTQFEKNNSVTIFEKYNVEPRYNLEQLVASDLVIHSKNLCDNSKTTEGLLTNSNQGKFGYARTDGSYANSACSPFIKIKANTNYAISHTKTTSTLKIYVSSSLTTVGNAIGTFIETNQQTYILSVDHDCYIRVSTGTGTRGDKFQVEEGSEVTTFEEYGYYPNPNTFFINEDNPYKGKKLFIFGDSIMAATTSGVDGIGKQLEEKYGMIYTRYAVDGKTITVDSGNRSGSILYEVEQASSVVPDYIIWNGGTNDLSNWSTLTKGTISSGFVATLDETTFCGAFEKTIKTLMTKYPGARIIFCTTHVNGGRGGTNESALPDQVEIWDLCRQMCHKWGIPVADIYWDSGLNSFLTEYKGVFTDAGGTHPNTNGYKLFYLPVIEHKM